MYLTRTLFCAERHLVAWYEYPMGMIEECCERQRDDGKWGYMVSEKQLASKKKKSGCTSLERSNPLHAPVRRSSYANICFEIVMHCLWKGLRPAGLFNCVHHMRYQDVSIVNTTMLFRTFLLCTLDLQMWLVIYKRFLLKWLSVASNSPILIEGRGEIWTKKSCIHESASIDLSKQDDLQLTGLKIDFQMKCDIISLPEILELEWTMVGGNAWKQDL